MTNIFDITDEDFNSLLTVLEQMQQRYNLEDDIHNHSRFLGNLSKTFSTLDNKYQISNISESFDEVYNQINQYTNDVQVLEVLNTIKRFNGIEPETQLNLKDLLIRTWSLATNVFSPNNMKDAIIFNLKHNKLAGGGCLAGISARLIQPYCFGIRYILESAKQYKTSNNPMPILFSSGNDNSSSSLQQINNNISQEVENDNLVQACELSRIAYLEQQQKIMEEEEELQLALAISSSLSITQLR